MKKHDEADIISPEIKESVKDKFIENVIKAEVDELPKMEHKL